jgi:HipA-like protein
MLRPLMDSRPALTVLHVSDFHFGRYHRFEGDDGLGSLLDRLRQDLDERRDRDGLRPDLIVLSGDFAEYGLKAEFERAQRFAQGLARLVELPNRRVVMVPGNHDVNWKRSQAYFLTCEDEGVTPAMPYWPKFKHYAEFFARFYEGESGIAFTEEEPWSFFEYPELGVVVAGLDSAMIESHRAEDHHGFLGERQLRAFAEKLRPYKERGFLRIGVVHHDPLQRRAPKAEEDSRDLNRLLRPWLNLVLHGDVHEERLQWLYGNVPIFGVGSAAVGVDQRAPEIPNEYQILQISRAGVRQGLRAYVPDQKMWKGSTRADDAGDHWMIDVAVAFDRVQVLGEAIAAAPAVDLVQIVESYRRAIARDQGTPTVFDLLGVNESGESAGGLDFLRVFVPQNAVRAVPTRAHREERYQSEFDFEASKEPRRSAERAGFAEIFFERTQPIDKLLGGGDAQHIFLLGAPGAGKTALTRWLLLKLCAPGEGAAGLLDGLIPVRIEMRRFDEAYRNAAGLYTFFDYLDREHGERFLSLRGESLRKLAREGRIYWLFDGLDEVIDETRRRRYSEMIAGLIAEHRECRSLVTSRPAGAEIARPLLEGARFQTYTLQDLTDEQRDHFLDVWHELVFARDPGVGRQRRARIAGALSNTTPIRELCKSPLLCALLAYLNREEELPQGRHRLYQKILERMAEHWDANKGLLPVRHGQEHFDIDSKLLFLRRLAWHMLAERTDGASGEGNAIDQVALEAFAAHFCEERWTLEPFAARLTAEALIRQLRERNYVLAFYGGTTYGFAHRTFLEYLAAMEAHERFRGRRWELVDLEKLFAQRWQEPAWEEALLLLCGFLADDEPDHVVRVLQGVAGLDRAVVYGDLDEYLAFCIKALGELSRLDRGVPFEFARAMNDIFELKISKGRLNHSSLTDAFRRCAGRWPEVERLMAVTTAARTDTRRMWMTELSSCWIAAAGKDGRLPVLVAALAERDVFPYRVCSEAAALGPWSVPEVERLCKVASARGDEQDRFNILTSIVLHQGIQWNVDDLPIRLLLELMRGSNLEDIRSRSAWILMSVGCHREEVLSAMRGFVGSKSKGIARDAAACLADAGYGDEVVAMLGRTAPDSPSSMVVLAKLARTSAKAQHALGEALASLRDHPVPRMFIDVATEGLENGFSLVSEDEIVAHLHRIEDRQLRIGILDRMKYTSTLCPLAVAEYREEYRSAKDESDRASIASDITFITLERAGEARSILADLWREILSSEHPHTSINMGGHILRSAHDPVIRSSAKSTLEHFLSDNYSEDVRIHAARNLGVKDPVGLEAHVVLSRTAQQETNRFTAACFIGDLEVLESLAEKATDSKWRDLARKEMEVYGQINFLLQIGRPRRARVRFHDRDIGILEELSAGKGTRFTYSPDYLTAPGARPLAPNLPLRAEPYEDPDTLHPFFANLLPEGPLYERTARHLGLRRADRFGVLLRVGADVMGAVQIFPTEKP